VPCRIRAEQSNGESAEKFVEKAPADCDGGAGDGGGGDDPISVSGNFTILAANVLGMHCADQDYRIFSILPPYNVLNAQVLKKGQKPEPMSPADGITVTYKAVESNIIDPNNPDLPPIDDSKNSTSENNFPTVYKSNFWEPSETSPGDNGVTTYESLYPSGLLGSPDFPSEIDLGLPAPDLALLYFGADRIPDTGDEPGMLAAHQTAMPGITDPAKGYPGWLRRLS